MSDATSRPEAPHAQIDRDPPGRSGVARLPDVHGPLIGRERDLAELVTLLRRPGTRLLTLTGAGGTGKTRLALELAALERPNHPDGVVFVSLASIAGAGQVPLAIAQALGVRETADASIEDRLPTLLHGRALLLVLDNFEHVLDAAPMVANLLAACPRLTVLATSRAPLRLSSEREVSIPPLDLPGPGTPPRAHDVADVAAVRLFVERARSIVPGFALAPWNADAIVAICRRLDGLPLAIELAAGRSRVLDPPAMLDRLEQRLPLLTRSQRDLPARQRTMRDTIAWSYGLLRECERMLFRRLAVFAGGFTLELAESMSRELATLQRNQDAHGMTAPGTPMLVLDTLETLIDHHLVERDDRGLGDTRFTILETIREYALEQLEASSELAEVRHAHAVALTTWAEYANPLLFEPEQALWLARGGAEQPNILTALDWALERGDADIAYRLASANGPNWIRRSRFREALAWLDRVFALSGPAPDDACTFCHILAGWSANSLDQVDKSLEHHRTALIRGQASGDRFGEGLARLAIGFLLIESDIDAAEREMGAALGLLRSLPGQPRVTSGLLGIARIAQCRGEISRFVDLAKAAYDHAVAAGDWWQVGYAGLVQAEADVLVHDFQEAIRHVAEAIRISDDVGSDSLRALAIRDAALVAQACGNHRLAVRWVTAAKLADASAELFPDRAYVEQLAAVVDAATAAIGAKAIGIEEQAAGTLPLAAAAAEVRAYRPAVGREPARHSLAPSRLTARELEVLRLVASGLTDARIADDLFIARSTVSRHVGNILAKLDASSRTAAVDSAYRLGLIERPGSPRPDLPPHT